MATTDDELDTKRQRVEKLRQQVAQELTKRTEREAGLVNDVAAAQLDAEATRLEAMLEQAKAANKVAAVKSGAASVLAAVKADQVQAQAQLDGQRALADADAKNEQAAKDADVEPDAQATGLPVVPLTTAAATADKA